MHFALHIGAHFTDEDRLLKGLLKNKARLTKQGVAVPGPGRYRRLIRETLQSLGETPPPSDAREILLDAILEQDKVERVCLSNPDFICVAQRIFENNTFYPQAEAKLAGFARLFPDDEVEIFLSMRDPATLITELKQRVDAKFLPTLMGGVDPLTVRWSDLILRIKNTLPLSHLTVWCNEDTPFLWGDILKRVSGDKRRFPLVGAHDILAEIMTEAGFTRFETYLKDNPAKSPAHLERIIGVFLDKFARADVVEMDLPEDITGWTAEYAARLTETYEEDLDQIADIPGVSFLRPSWDL